MKREIAVTRRGESDMRAARTVNSWAKAWGLTLLSLAIFHIFPAQAQQDTLTDLAAQGNAPPVHHPKHHTYTLIDLGTFGGPQSFVNFPIAGYFSVLNNSGTVAGWADTSVPDPHPNICFQDCYVEHAFLSKGFGKTDLGSLPAPIPTSSQPNWVADSGLLAGVSENGELDPLVLDLSGLPFFPEFRAVLWRKNGIVNLGTLDGGYESVANAVNDDGQVVGLFTNTIPDANSMFFGIGYQTRAFSWKGGIMQDLGTLGGTNAQALLVNERGQVVGESYLNSNPSPACAAMGLNLNLATGAFLWEKGEMRNLGSLGGTCTVPSDLNDRGQIVGISSLPGDQNVHAFLWENGTMKDLGNTFGGPGSAAIAINNAGHAVGWGQPAGEKFAQRASLWKNGVQTDLGTFATDCAFADTINSKDQIAGASYPNCNFEMPGRGFLYENGELVDLNTLIPPLSKLYISEPETINDRGEIAGIGFTIDGKEDQHAFLLIPNGDCDDNCEARIAASKSDAAVALQAGATVNAGSSTPLHSRFGRLARRYHIPGLAVAIVPFNLTASALNTYQVELNWQIASAQNQAGFNIYRCHGCSAPRTQGVKIASVGASAFTYIDGSSSHPLTETTSFTYEVTAFTGAGESGPSKPASVTTKIEPAPTNLTSVGIEDYGRGHRVRLNWTNNSTDDDSYHIEACSGSTCTNFGEIAQIAANATTYVESLHLVVQDWTYRYRVRAHSPGGYSSYSNIRTQILP